MSWIDHAEFRRRQEGRRRNGVKNLNQSEDIFLRLKLIHRSPHFGTISNAYFSSEFKFPAPPIPQGQF
jgi:hypothetical protein